MARSGFVTLLIIIVILVSVSVFYYARGDDGQPTMLTGLDEEDDTEDESIPMLRKHRPMIYEKDDFEQLSPWQKFVTPNDPLIRQLAEGLGDVREVYREAVSWTWVSDDILNGKSEKWLMPHEFLSETPTYPTNPVKGNVVSDCEEQAYTLVSVLRAFGVPATDVRVVVGEISMEGETGGHAWVEILEEGQWLQLEATSGPYWDDETGKYVNRRGGGFLYYMTHPYPVVEVWGYFNEAYYYNPANGMGNAPHGWKAN